MTIQQKRSQATRRAARTRSKMHGTAERPRLSVHRTAKHMSAQFINDDAGVTVLGMSDVKAKHAATTVKSAQAFGAMVGEAATKAGITAVVYDKGPYLYHGRVKAFADAVREAGINM